MNDHPVQAYITRTRFGWRWKILTFGSPRYKPALSGWRRSEEKARARCAHWLPILRAEFNERMTEAEWRRREQEAARRLYEEGNR